LGDGAIVVIPLLFFALYRYSHALILLWAALFHILFVNLGKRVLFKGFPRPAEFLKDIDFYQVPGVELHHWNSFPSGHTTTIFMLCAVLSMVLPKRLRLQPLLFTLAVLVGFSRIYLMQHFWIDVFAGSALGVSSALLGHRLTLAFFSKKKFQRGLLTKPKRLLPQPSN
jgi:membrane-associated phospholipid phosphatase